MICLILCGGYATRLYPLTENFPKPLLPVKGKAILDYLVDDLESLNKIKEYTIVSNSKFFNYFKKWADNRNEKIRVLEDGAFTNETRFGAVKDIQFAIDELKIDDDILVLAGDNLIDFSFCGFIDYFYLKKSTCVMRYLEEDSKKCSKSAVLDVDDTDRVRCFEEKPKKPLSKWCCPPFYIYAKEDIKKVKMAIDEGCNTDAPGSFISWLYLKSSVYAYKMPGRRYDIGDLESYKKVKNEYFGIKKDLSDLKPL